MEREIEQELVTWKERKEHKPLLLRGARQVGKTFIIRQFGKRHFRHVVEINFELQPECIPFFDDLKPTVILNFIETFFNLKIIAGETLLFLDEIQDCPRAIMALRYFWELHPELHVIAAGSLLEFALENKNFRMPVGRIQSLYLKPMSFSGFLREMGQSSLNERLQETNLNNPLPEVFHTQLLQLVKEYMIVGGLPEAVQRYVNTKNFYECQQAQTDIHNTYRGDLAKYSSKVHFKYLRVVFDRVPHLIAKHFKYVKVDRELLSRDIKESLELLKDAGYLYQILSRSIGQRSFKILMIDVGLATRTSGVSSDLLLADDVLNVSEGAISEQFVGQELLAYTDPHEPGQLFFWRREKTGSSAEVDFVASFDSRIVPIEVKAGSTGKLKSLYAFMKEQRLSLGIRISQAPLSLEQGVLSVPFYLIGSIPQLIKTV